MKRLFKFSALLLLISLVLPSSILFSYAEEDASALFDSFEDIPGITQEEIDAVESIKDSRDSLKFATVESTEGFKEKDGSIGGYVAALSEKFSNLFGIEFEPQIVDRPGMFEGLDNKTIDLSCGIAETPEISSKYILSLPLMKRNVVIYRMGDSEPLSLIARERDAKYVFFEAAQIHDQVSELSTIPFESYFAADYEEAYQKILNKEADAIIIDNSAKADFDAFEDVEYSDFLPNLQRNVPVLTGNPELEPIISIIDKYLQNGGVDELHQMYASSQLDYHKYKFTSLLTPEESAYLNEHLESGDKIPFLPSYDNYPICFYNNNTGEYQGISIDVLKEISNISGMEFEPVNKVGTPWYEVYELLENGEGAFVPELLYTKERAEKFIWTDEGYSRDAYALLSKIDSEEVDLEKISEYKIGIISETAYANLFKQWFPEQEGIVEFSSYNDGFNSLGKGEIDFLMGTKYLLLNIGNYLEQPGYKANHIFDYVSDSAFGFNSDEKVLCSIMSKAQKMIDTEGIAERWSLKAFDYKTKIEEDRRIYLVGAGILAACVMILLVVLFFKNRNANIKLEHIVDERTSELALQTQAAQVASEAKSNFLARMSHEIRTPLNAILGMSNIVKKGVEKDEKLSTDMGEIISASTHLLGILNDILDMSKIEAGKLWLADGVFDIKEAMQEVCRMMVQSADEGGINFNSNIDELKPLMIIGDKLRLKQVVINLLGNAFKFTPDGGEVNFNVSIDMEDKKATISFVVKDSGIGISEEQISKLFVAFEQGDGTIASRFGGAGLGLSISQSLVNEMGGAIEVESEIGKGSTFSFTIRTDIAELVENELVKDVDVDLTGKRILIVEDVEINRIILCELLSDTNVTIEEAEDGMQGLEKFENSAESYYDLIFMDIQMPNMNGYEATEKIRVSDHPDALSIPIIAMTANAFSEDVEHALSSGMNAHLAKPIDINLVKKILKKVLIDNDKI